MAFEVHGAQSLILTLCNDVIEFCKPHNMETNSLESSLLKSGQPILVVVSISLPRADSMTITTLRYCNKLTSNNNLLQHYICMLCSNPF